MSKKAIENNNELEFAIFCIENIADRININPEKVYDMLSGNDSVLNEYIIPSYDVLHTQGKEYIVDDIIDVMEKQKII